MDYDLMIRYIDSQTWEAIPYVNNSQADAPYVAIDLASQLHYDLHTDIALDIVDALNAGATVEHQIKETALGTVTFWKQVN